MSRALRGAGGMARACALVRVYAGVALQGVVACIPAVASLALADLDMVLGHSASPLHELFFADTGRNASVVLGTDSKEGRVQDYAVQQLTFNVAVYTLIPLTSAMYFRGSVRGVSEAVFASFLFGQLLVMCLSVYTSMDKTTLTAFCFLVAQLVQLIATEAMLPNDCHAGHEFALCGAAVLLAVGALYGMAIMPAGDSLSLATVLVAVPLARELCTALALQSAWKLASDSPSIGRRLSPNRRVTWPLIAWVPATFGCAARLVILGMQSVALQAAAVLGLAAAELALAHSRAGRHQRLLRARISVVNRATLVLKPRGERYVVPEPPLQRQETQEQRDKRLEETPPSFNEFYGVSVLLDAVTDVGAILLAFAAVALGRQRPLFYRYDYYLRDAARFDQEPGLEHAGIVTGVQLAIAALVHTVSATRASSWRVHLVEAWDGRPATWLAMLSLSLWFAISLVTMFALSRDGLEHCYGKRLCDCVPDGLRSPGVVQEYCSRIANSSGL